MKLRKLAAIASSSALLLGLLAGCGSGAGNTVSDNGTDSSSASASQAETSNYAYEADYISLSSLEGDNAYVQKIASCQNNVYLAVQNMQEDGTFTTETYTDENGTEQTEEIPNYSYTISIYCVDTTTKTVSKLGEVPVPEKTEGHYTDWPNINCMQVDTDGSLWLGCSAYEYWYELPEDFDASTGDETDYYMEDNHSYMVHLAADGSILAQISPVDENGNVVNAYSIFFIDGSLIVADAEKIYKLDENGRVLDSCETDFNSFIQYNADTAGITCYEYDADTDTGSMYLKVFHADTMTFGETIPLPANSWTIYPGDDAFDCYYTYNSNIFGYHTDTASSEKLVDWMTYDINSDNLNSICLLSDGTVAAEYYNGDEGANELAVLHRVDAAAVTQKTELTLACYGLDYDLRSRIIAFNKSNSDYRIVVNDYSEYDISDGSSAGLTRLNTEIMSGVIPDMFVVDSLPVEKYEAMGIIADLYEVMASAGNMSKEDFVPQILAALEKDGKLYEIPQSFSVFTALGLASVTGGYDTWNLAALNDAMTKLNENASVLGDYFIKSEALSDCISRSIDSFVDWDNASCSFDSDAFKALLEFANSFPAEYSDAEDAELYDADVYEDEVSRISSGKQLLNPVTLYSFGDAAYSICGYTEDVKLVGYPSEDGKHCSSFGLDGSMAISSVSSHKDICWQFISEALSEDYQDPDSYNIWTFPVNLACFNRSMEKVSHVTYLTDDEGNQMDYDGDGDPDPDQIGGFYGSKPFPDDYRVYNDAGEVVAEVDPYDNTGLIVYALSEKQISMIMDCIDSTTSVSRTDNEIMDIIADECAAYFAGSKSVDDTAAMVQSRVSLYIMEQS